MAPLQRQRSTATAAGDAGQLQIQHFIHQHPLNKLFMAFEFNCNGCNTGGHGLRYRCSACNFDLHEHCATSPHHLISSHIHPHHQLVLVNHPGSSHFCDVCNDFTDGLRYTCQTCEFDVHILCTKIPVATGVQEQQGGTPWVQSTAPFGNNSHQPMMINHHQQQQGMQTTTFGGYQGVNNNGQPMMVNHQNTTTFGGYNHEANISEPMMINHQQYQQQMQQQQGMIPTTSFGGYHGVNSNNQGVMMKHHQQQQGIPTTTFVGYQNQPIMMNQQQMQNQQQAAGKSNNYSKVGKFAANVLVTSLIGVPINFNSKNRQA